MAHHQSCCCGCPPHRSTHSFPSQSSSPAPQATQCEAKAEAAAVPTVFCAGPRQVAAAAELARLVVPLARRPDVARVALAVCLAESCRRARPVPGAYEAVDARARCRALLALTPEPSLVTHAFCCAIEAFAMPVADVAVASGTCLSAIEAPCVVHRAAANVAPFRHVRVSIRSTQTLVPTRPSIIQMPVGQRARILGHNGWRTVGRQRTRRRRRLVPP